VAIIEGNSVGIKGGICMKKSLVIVALAMALVLAMSFTGCSALKGNDGLVYGDIWWSSSYTLYTSGLASTGGFPSTITKSVDYEITPGSYYFYYDLYDGYYYSGWWTVTYTVTANAGSYILQDGEDKYFEINCYWSTGPSITGLNIVETTPAKTVGNTGEIIKEYTNGNYTITLKYSKTETPPDPSTVVKQ
jgi:hypothetical protein